MHPESPLPDRWNPFRPLVVSDPVTPFTSWKLDQAASDPQQCLAILGQTSSMQVLPDKIVDGNCGIAPRVSLRSVDQTQISEIETSCATALRLAMWNTHGVQPAAEFYLGQKVVRLRHSGSYNCRRMRTSSSGSSNWSSHAQAMAIDISGFDLADGSKLRLINDWDRAGDTRLFMRAVRDSACQWFRLTLSPDYNALHADHFHLQATGWGACR